MLVDACYPTKNEATALAALVPRNQTCNIPVNDYLHRLIRFCERKDVRDFLFNKDPFQLTYLSKHNLADSAVSGLLTNTSVERGTSRNFSYHVRSMFFFAPVFATDNLNFGFGVHEHVFNPADLWETLNPGFFGRSLSRFVRDDSEGIMVVVLDFPEMDMIQVDYTQLVNATGQIHSIARFRRHQLHTIYESGIFNLSSLTGAMESIHASFQIRECPGCGARPDCGTIQQPCNCELPRAFPKHPFDISSFYRNMERRLGTFQGLARVNLFDGGRKVHGVLVGNSITIKGGVDSRLIDRLQKWAICSSAPPEDPLQSLMQYSDAQNARSLLSGAQYGIENEANMQIDLPLADIDGDWYGTASDSQFQAALESIEDIPGDQIQNELQLPSDERNGGKTNGGTDVSEGSLQADPGNSTTEGRTSSSDSRVTSTVPSGSGTGTEDRDLVKKLRAELRKERNRASAQRSNLRKKAENDARKLEIKTNKEKAALLRAKEMSLRQENMRLRQQLVDKSEEER